ncbi:flagellar motor switch protein FliN [Paludibacterium sp. dN 18-1]|uniref:Flagellar motor switch protein FliN n=2 Tax=Paludibacterium denitrificans TaxID=2675226 RepID=A0A844G942_9NEIS|nr:flagellar motor switch protein FliN [Paludibacterium denitrificans]
MEPLNVDSLLDDMIPDNTLSASEPVSVPPRRDMTAMLRKIPVTLTLEVGSATVSLHELQSIHTDSVIELDRLAGEPLLIKVNGVELGRAEVVVAGENYGLRVVELNPLDLDSLA